MQLTYTTPDGRIKFEFEATNVKDAFMKIGMLQEAFEADTACGCCGSPRIKLEMRTAGEYVYYELRCNACKARLDFGQAKKGGALFAKRDEHPDTAGWYVYQGEGQQRDEWDQSPRRENYDQRQEAPPPPMRSQPRGNGGVQPPGRTNAQPVPGITDDDVPF